MSAWPLRIRFAPKMTAFAAEEQAVERVVAKGAPPKCAAAAPLEINYLVGKKASKFEMGLGTVVCADRYTSDNGAKPQMSCGLIPYLSLGYRLVTEKGFLLRAGALPLFDFSDKQFGLYPYLSFGWAF